MRIKRYYAFDCDSEMGFNNGYYVDDEPIEVASTNEAYDKCYEILKERFELPDDPDQAEPGYLSELKGEPGGYELVTEYLDDEGNEISYDQFLELNEDGELGGWRYVYSSYTEEP